MKGHRNRGGWAAFILLAVSAIGTAKPTSMPVPGTVNYVEGQVSLNGQNLSVKSPGSTLLEAGKVLETGKGRVELLLTPGVFFRAGDKIHQASATVPPFLGLSRALGRPRARSNLMTSPTDSDR